MESFRWNSCFITGLADVDAQHHALVDVINRFGGVLVSREGVAFSAIEAIGWSFSKNGPLAGSTSAHRGESGVKNRISRPLNVLTSFAAAAAGILMR